MKRNLMIGLVLAALGAGGFLALNGNGPAEAQKSAQHAAIQTQSAVFAIENMTCATCPITVKKAMQSVEGVKSVAVDFDAKTATVIFDPAMTTTDSIGEASTNAGFAASFRS